VSVPRSAPVIPATQPPASGTATHQAVAVAVGDAVGIPVPPSWSVDRSPPIDWARFADLVAGHAVAPLIRRSFWVASLSVPRSADARLHLLARRATSANLRTLAVLGEVETAAARWGVDLVVLAGPALAEWAYGDPLARHNGHLRLLVDPGAVTDAARLLGDLGFEAIDAGTGSMADEVTFARGRAFVDLRWRLFTNTALLPVDLTDPRSRLRVDVGGLAVTTLGRELTWWYLAAHGTQHRWSSLRWLADVPAVLAACPGLLAPAALERSAAVGVDRCVATAMSLAADLLGLSLPPDAADWVAARRGCDRLVRQSRRYLVASEGQGSDRAPAGLVERVSFALGIRADARYRRETLRLALVEGAHDRLGPLTGWARSLVRTTA
jgi:hypothetical protein